jgi:hypothetical protein
MPIREIFRLAIEALIANKLRSALTMLGLIIGVGAVVLLVSIGNGAKLYVTGQFEGLGTNLIMVQPGRTDQKRAFGPPIGGMKKKMTLADVEALFAALVLEIHVDVGRLGALFREETLEEQAHLHGVDAGDAQAPAQHRIGGGTAALAEDALAAREADQVVDGQEVVGVAQAVHHRQLVLQLRAHARRHAVGIAQGCSLGRAALQVLLGAVAGRHPLGGVLVAQLAQAEVASGCCRFGVGQGLGPVAEERGALVRRLKMAAGADTPTRVTVVNRHIGDIGE